MATPALAPRSAVAVRVAPKDPQALFQEKLSGYITRHVRAGTLEQLPSALRKVVAAPGNSFDSSLLLPAKTAKQPALAIIDMNTGPNRDLVIHHARKPNDGYVLLAAAVGTQHPLSLTNAVDISTPALAALKASLAKDQRFNAELASKGFKFSDLKFVVGDAIGKKDGGDFAGEFTDSGAGRYGVYVPGAKGKPAFAKNYLIQSDVTLEGEGTAKVLRAKVGTPREETL